MGIITDHCIIVPIKDDEQWHAERSQGIGGSDVGALLGLSNYASAYSVWALKSGLVDKEPAGEAARWGHLLEPTVADAYAEDTGEALVEWPNISLISKKYPFMRANVDRLIVEPSDEFPAGVVTVWDKPEEPPGVIGLFEAKTAGIASYGTAHHWDDGAIPEGYMMQGYHYGIVTGIRDIRYGALLAGQGLVTRELDWDDDTADNIIQVESWFWSLVESGQEPPVDGSDATAKVLEARHREPDKEHDGGDLLAEMWAEYREFQDVADQYAKKAKEARAKMLQAIGDAEVAMANGEKLFTYKLTAPRKSIDTDALKAERPEVYEQYLKVGNPYRRLMPARKKEA